MIDRSMNQPISLTNSLTHSFIHSLTHSLTHSLIFATLSDYDKITYLMNLGNDNTCKLVGKYIH